MRWRASRCACDPPTLERHAAAKQRLPDEYQRLRRRGLSRPADDARSAPDPGRFDRWRAQRPLVVSGDTTRAVTPAASAMSSTWTEWKPMFDEQSNGLIRKSGFGPWAAPERAATDATAEPFCAPESQILPAASPLATSLTFLRMQAGHRVRHARPSFMVTFRGRAAAKTPGKSLTRLALASPWYRASLSPSARSSHRTNKNAIIALKACAIHSNLSLSPPSRVHISNRHSRASSRPRRRSTNSPCATSLSLETADSAGPAVQARASVQVASTTMVATSPVAKRSDRRARTRWSDASRPSGALLMP